MSSHYKPEPEALKSLVIQDGDKWIVKPRALEIAWGGDHRYWLLPSWSTSAGPIELVQVSWLEVTGSLDMARLKKGQDYKVSFKLELKPDAFGWKDTPVYLMAKPGETKPSNWKPSDFSRWMPGVIFEAPHTPVLKFTVPMDVAVGDKLQFGMYEIWKGRWKGGLVIHEAVIEPL